MSGSDELVGALALVSSQELLNAVVGKQNVVVAHDPALRKAVRSKLDAIVGTIGRERENIEELKTAINKLYSEMFPGTWNLEEAARKKTKDNKARRAEAKARRAKAGINPEVAPISEPPQ